MHKAWEVSQNKVQFENESIYSDDLINFYEKFNVYEISQSDAWTYPSADREALAIPGPRKAFFSYTFHQSQVEVKTKSARATLY